MDKYLALFSSHTARHSRERKNMHHADRLTSICFTTTPLFKTSDCFLAGNKIAQHSDQHLLADPNLCGAAKNEHKTVKQPTGFSTMGTKSTDLL